MTNFLTTLALQMIITAKKIELEFMKTIMDDRPNTYTMFDDNLKAQYYLNKAMIDKMSIVLHHSRKVRKGT